MATQRSPRWLEEPDNVRQALCAVFIDFIAFSSCENGCVKSFLLTRRLNSHLRARLLGLVSPTASHFSYNWPHSTCREDSDKSQRAAHQKIAHWSSIQYPSLVRIYVYGVCANDFFCVYVCVCLTMHNISYVCVCASKSMNTQKSCMGWDRLDTLGGWYDMIRHDTTLTTRCHSRELPEISQNKCQELSRASWNVSHGELSSKPRWAHQQAAWPLSHVWFTVLTNGLQSLPHLQPSTAAPCCTYQHLSANSSCSILFVYPPCRKGAEWESSNARVGVGIFIAHRDLGLHPLHKRNRLDKKAGNTWQHRIAFVSRSLLRSKHIQTLLQYSSMLQNYAA